MRLGADVDGAYLEMLRLERTEGLLNLGQILVTLVDHLLVGHLLGRIGFDDITAVKSRGPLQRILIYCQAQRASLGPDAKPRLDLQLRNLLPCPFLRRGYPGPGVLG